MFLDGDPPCPSHLEHFRVIKERGHIPKVLVNDIKNDRTLGVEIIILLRCVCQPWRHQLVNQLGGGGLES